MAKILVVGSLNMDLVVQTDRVPQQGETVMGTDFHQYFGGKGANQAVAVARLGAQCTMVGCVGQDSFGEAQLVSLQAEGIDTRFIKIHPTYPSGIASIILDGQGNNRIIIVSGANGALEKKDLDEALSAFDEADVVVFQLEVPLDVVEYGVELAYQRQKPVVLNPAPAQSLPSSLFSKITVFTPNETEAEFYSGVKVEDDESVRLAARRFREWGVPNIIITLGSRGVYGLSETEEFQLPSFSVPVVDTVGAGDSFTGALAVALGEGKSLQDAASFANTVAALAVTKPGAQPGMPTRSEVEDFLKD